MVSYDVPVKAQRVAHSYPSCGTVIKVRMCINVPTMYLHSYLFANRYFFHCTTGSLSLQIFATAEPLRRKTARGPPRTRPGWCRGEWPPEPPRSWWLRPGTLAMGGACVVVDQGELMVNQGQLVVNWWLIDG